MRGLLCIALTAAACIEPIDEESVPGRSARVIRDCVVPGIDSAPTSLELDEGSLWMWSEPDRFALVTSVDDACEGVAPQEGAIVPLTADEIRDNETRSDGRRTVAVPRGGFAHQGRGVLYYDLVIRGPGIFDEERLGTGVCGLEAPGAPCDRADETLLWRAPEAAWGASGFVDDDGFAYLAACFHVAAFEDLCGVARVLPIQVAEPTAYRYFSWAQAGTWIDDPTNFTVAFEGTGRASLGRTAGGVLAISPDIWDSTIEARAAASPWGEYQREWTVAKAAPPDEWFIGGGAWHRSLGDDERIVVSYHTDDGVHLVEVVAP